MKYEELMIKHEHLKIREADFSQIDPEEELSGLCVEDHIFIRKDLPTIAEKSCVLAEEIGHYYTSHGNILDQSKVENRKQEKRARNWAYNQLIRIEDLINAYQNGVRNRYELADFLGVTEEFLEEALKHMGEKYGLAYSVQHFVIYFNPLMIYESFEKRYL